MWSISIDLDYYDDCNPLITINSFFLKGCPSSQSRIYIRYFKVCWKLEELYLSKRFPILKMVYLIPFQAKGPLRVPKAKLGCWAANIDSFSKFDFFPDCEVYFVKDEFLFDNGLFGHCFDKKWKNILLAWKRNIIKNLVKSYSWHINDNHEDLNYSWYCCFRV